MHVARRVSLAVVLLLLGLTARAPIAHAQQVSGTVRDSASQLPLPGTRVLILDAAGRPAAGSTTDQLGRFRLAPWARRTTGRAASTLRLRVLRMGFRPRELPLPRAGANSALEISLVSFPVVLEEVQVMAASCPKRADRAAALGLLQQVRMALFATVLAHSQSSATMSRLLYDRRLDSRTGRILSQSVRTRVTSATSEAFSAERSASAFGREGFLRDSSGFHSYLGPDAETLVDDAFASKYCFRITAPDRSRPRQVGLGFEPVEREDGRIDIVGTVWVDTLTRVLQDLTFRYVGLDRETSALAPEGRLSFRELPNGVVIIDQWSLRLAGEGGGTTSEIGGEIARATWPGGYSWGAPLGTIRLHAVDNQGRPAAASMVQLIDTDYQLTTDSTANVVLTDLLPGPYSASVRDPRLATLGVPSTKSIRFTAVRDSTVDARFEVETADDFVRKRCGQEMPAAGKGWVLGRAVTTGGAPVKEARWSIRDEFGTMLVEDAKVDAEGMFQWCQLPLNRRVTIDVWRDDRRVNASRIVMDRLTTLHFVLPD